MFDLRSDTVTRPSEAMRRAMAEAEVGDDVYREDPTVRRLEERTAEIVGTEAALFVPSGTMSNQLALLCHCRPGDEVLVGHHAHCMEYESGAAAAWSGVQFVPLGTAGLFTAEEVAAAIRPPAYYQPRTRLCVVENTHNMSGGRVFPRGDAEAITELCAAESLATHLDGARLWHAAAATGTSERELARGFDTVTVCFSKGLGAPVGSALCGDADTIDRALRLRKMLGGGMRQAGIIAAGALFALETNRSRLVEDHRAAQELAAALGEVGGVSVDPVETNIVCADLDFPASRLVEQACREGVLIGATGPSRVRLVTHCDVTGPTFAAAVTAVRRAAEEARRGG
ncbi:MAG: aminotransferase class I/II-fold pyridoxal phosphate-dependent enzyme [Deltaproteobacteria bacterium]|jgi:threonine aldolase|nr:aminotransferase class I/II-fold pyridoxal phosphate-dependent enzyme [Deltaproteobacteria bacterium]MBW2531970.1 aminotransferase class I/II-fold pyridoxal phosphate-dependent enzyme [Deltaproteobacteria bacterium]